MASFAFLIKKAFQIFDVLLTGGSGRLVCGTLLIGTGLSEIETGAAAGSIDAEPAKA